MNLSKKYDINGNVIITIEISQLDMCRAELPKALTRWYSSLKHPFISDELFYLSEVAESLEKLK